VFSTAVVACGAACAFALAAPSPHGSRISIAITPEGTVKGLYLFKIRVRGFAAETRSGPYAHSRDALFVFPGQTAACGANIYAENDRSRAGEGYSYTVGPGAFNLTARGFADASWRRGYVCAYIAPLDFELADRGGVPLGPLAAHTQRLISFGRIQRAKNA
jgi:hypothetical protein